MDYTSADIPSAIRFISQVEVILKAIRRPHAAYTWITATGTFYNYATASTVAPINLGNRHAGSAAQALSVSNLAAADGFSEKLDDVAVASNSGAVQASGAIGGLNAGSSDSGSIQLALGGGAGVRSGSAVLAFISDGAGIT